MAGDAGVSLGVVVSAAVIAVTGWSWLDPVVSLAIVAVIVAGTWGLLREAIDMALDAAPAGVDLTSIEAFLRGGAGVTDVHDLHVWAMSTSEVALTAHLVRPSHDGGDQFCNDMVHALEDRFGGAPRHPADRASRRRPRALSGVLRGYGVADAD